MPITHEFGTSRRGAAYWVRAAFVLRYSRRSIPHNILMAMTDTSLRLTIRPLETL